MKKKIITGSILAVIVIVAVIIFGTVFNERATEKTEAMKGASLPVISFKEGEYTINTLFGYTGSMDMTSESNTQSFGTFTVNRTIGLPFSPHPQPCFLISGLFLFPSH